MTIHAPPLHGARREAGCVVELQGARVLHLFVPRGEVTLEGAGPLREGDAGHSPRRVDSASPRPRRPKILVWEMHADLAGARSRRCGRSGRPAGGCSRPTLNSGTIHGAVADIDGSARRRQ